MTSFLRAKINQCFLLTLFAITLVILAEPAYAQRRSAQRSSGLKRQYQKNGSAIKSAFGPIVADASKLTVKIEFSGVTIALGTIVDPEGWILTKASQLPEEFDCVFSDKTSLKVTVVNINKTYDLAMLKVDEKDLETLKKANIKFPKINWNEEKDPMVGQWLASAAPYDGTLSAGVLSVPRRKIQATPGVLGISLDRQTGKTRITQIFPGSGAEKAGLKIDDVVTQINTKAVEDAPSLAGMIRKYLPGDEVQLRIKRGEEEIELSVTLGDRGVLPIPGASQNQMGTKLSKRRDGFPGVLQHDTPLQPHECGGPIVNLKGKVIGINIARAGRTESYAIPTETLLELIDELKTETVSTSKKESVPTKE